MNLPAMSLAALALCPPAGAPDTVPPYVSFPDPALDDPAAYQGYQTRIYRDTRRNAFQVYLNGRTGRVVSLWADAADESVGFSARDSAGVPAEIGWGSSAAVVAETRGGRTRTVSYDLEAPSPVTIGLFLLGSMRVERDFQYARRDTLPLGATAFPEPELTRVIRQLERLNAADAAPQFVSLGGQSTVDLRPRLVPQITATRDDTAWVVRVEQTSFDGKNHLTLTLAGDNRETAPTLQGSKVTIRRPAGGPVHFTVRITTDVPALTPLSRDEIFNDDFRRFYAQVAADTAHAVQLRRLEREVRGSELLCYREKLMAGLPNFATYFGRDMLMTALLMQPVWAPAMPEHVIASALHKLSPEGDVSHEEALGGQAIRENAGLYNSLMARGLVRRAGAVLADLQRVRENYIMVDDDFQLPVVVARYLVDPRVPAERKRRFLLAEQRRDRLVANLALVARRADPYVRDPLATNLVSFPRAPDGSWISASWRDSRAGYGGGRFALDVNAIWVPHALQAIGTIWDVLTQLDIAPLVRAEPLAGYLRDRRRLEHAVTAWQGAERHFRVALAPPEARARIDARVAWLPRAEGEYWDSVIRGASVPADSLRFLALSLDGAGHAIPIVNTDPAMLLLLEPLGLDRALELVGPIVQPYPWGLFVDGLGPLVVNDAYAPRAVWESFRRDPYHSPTVVWGRDVNMLLAGIAQQIAASSPGADVAPLRDALARTITAVDRSGLRHAELWSYAIDAGRLVPARYGTSSDVQLWSLTDLAVQYLLAPARP